MNNNCPIGKAPRKSGDLRQVDSSPRFCCSQVNQPLALKAASFTQLPRRGPTIIWTSLSWPLNAAAPIMTAALLRRQAFRLRSCPQSSLLGCGRRAPAAGAWLQQCRRQSTHNHFVDDGKLSICPAKQNKTRQVASDCMSLLYQANRHRPRQPNTQTAPSASPSKTTSQPPTSPRNAPPRSSPPTPPPSKPPSSSSYANEAHESSVRRTWMSSAWAPTLYTPHTAR
jgi:hypothetical protein